MNPLDDYSHERREQLGLVMLKVRALCDSYDRLGLGYQSATRALKRLRRFLRPSRGMRRHVRRMKAETKGGPR